jgi:hypothetical protein
MSFSAMRLVLRRSKHKGTHQHVFLRIADHINDDNGLAWMFHETLAFETGYSLRTIYNSIQALIDTKELEVIRGRNGQRSYRIMLSETVSGTRPEFVSGERPESHAKPSETDSGDTGKLCKCYRKPLPKKTPSKKHTNRKNSKGSTPRADADPISEQSSEPIMNQESTDSMDSLEANERSYSPEQLLNAGLTPGSLVWKKLTSTNGDNPHTD